MWIENDWCISIGPYRCKHDNIQQPEQPDYEYLNVILISPTPNVPPTFLLSLQSTLFSQFFFAYFTSIANQKPASGREHARSLKNDVTFAQSTLCPKVSLHKMNIYLTLSRYSVFSYINIQHKPHIYDYKYA